MIPGTVEMQYFTCNDHMFSDLHYTLRALINSPLWPYKIKTIFEGWLFNFVTFRGLVDDLSFFDYSSPFCFLLVGFHCIFCISFKIIPFYFY